MPPETDAIKQQMSQTRAALTEKLETLENQVVGTVRDTTNAVAGTVNTVQSTVRDTVQEVGSLMRDTVQGVREGMRETMSTVRDGLDVSRHVQRHPWLMLGGSVFAGFLGERLLERVEEGSLAHYGALPAGRAQRLPPSFEGEQARLVREPAPARPGPSFLQSLTDLFGPEIDKLKRLAVGTAIGLMRDRLRESVPPQFQSDLTSLLDRVTVKLGGEPTPPGSTFFGTEEDEERNGSKIPRSMGTL
jgi:hypothetical protein